MVNYSSMIANVLPETLVMMDFIVENGGELTFPDDEWLMESLIDAHMQVKTHAKVSPRGSHIGLMAVLRRHANDYRTLYSDCDCHGCMEHMWSDLT